MSSKNFSVKNGLTVGDIVIDAATGNISGNVGFTGANVSLGAVANLHITGGAAGYYLQTNGNSQLSWASITTQVAGSYNYAQTVPGTTWVVNHNLGVQYVNVMVADANGNSFAGRYDAPLVTFTGNNSLTITFTTAQTGNVAVTSGGGAQGPVGPVGNANVAGSNTQVQYNNNGIFGASSALTFSTSNSTLSTVAISATGNITGGNLTTTGNVGIGTTSPGAKLDVRGNIDAASSSTSHVRIAMSGGVGSITSENAGTQYEELRQTGQFVSFYTGQFGASERMRIDANGNVGIGNTAPLKKLIVSDSGTSSPTNGSAVGMSLVNTDVSNASISAYTVNLADPGGTLRHSATIAAGKDGNWSTGVAYPGYLSFWTRPNSTADQVERMRIDSSGNVGIGVTPIARLDVAGAGSRVRTDLSGATPLVSVSNPNAGSYTTYAMDTLSYDFRTNGSNKVTIDTNGNLLITSSGGLGYGTGSGGSVTQLTSRTTSVTINKTNGSIATVSAAGSATVAVFQVNNSTVSISDTVVLSIRNNTTNVYNAVITQVRNGSFDIGLYSLLGTSTDAPVINFAVIKAVTA